MNISGLEHYIYDRRVDELEGWLIDQAAFTIIQIGRWQETQGIQGGIAEIGVHHGKLFNLLALLRRQGEAAYAIDVFDLQEFNTDGSGKGDLDRFIANFAAHVGGTPPAVIRADSLTLRDRPFAEGGIRLFSVDGSHTAKHTANDIIVAFQNLAPGGLVIVDDWFNSEWPGVPEGVFDILRTHADVAPVAYGHNKLYLCRAEAREMYWKLFTQDLAAFFGRTKIVQLGSWDALFHVVDRDPRATTARDFSIAGLICAFGRPSKFLLLENGWSYPEGNGTWMTGREATAVLRRHGNLLEASSGKVSASLSVRPLLHPNCETRPLQVRIDGTPVFDAPIVDQTEVNFEIDLSRIGDSIRLELATDDPVSPSALGVKDDRLLSVFVGALAFGTRR